MSSPCRLTAFNRGIQQELNLHNHVYSLYSTYKRDKIILSSEIGQSSRTLINSDNEPWLNGQFLNLNLNYQYANNSYVELNYRRVTDDFSSPGSQTKRIDFSSSPNLFSTVNNNISPRDILISDLVNDIFFSDKIPYITEQ